MRIGVVVNPIAGMGGRVGLKGTDGKVAAAIERGAEPRAPERAIEALSALRERADDVEVVTWGGVMGAAEARAAGFEPTVLGGPDDIPDEPVTELAAEELTGSDATDTREAVRAFVEADVDLILFVGGDGTAVDVAETLSDLDVSTPMLGVPAGVKIYSSVFGVTPAAAGRIVAVYDTTEEREVVDIDEDAFRGGEVHTELRAIAHVPIAEDLQSGKQLASGTVEGVAKGVADDIRLGVTYVLGPGSTLGAVKRELGFDGTSLGVDVWRDGEVLAMDAAESEILEHLGEENVIIVSPIGGQGFIFGRGNQQISPAVIERSSVEVVASRRKLDGIGVLRVDTGDADVDESLRGWVRVRTGRFERRMMKIV
ncbi:MAG: ATP-NAD kinase family protein [Halobacteriales archaeon]|nr:ATP-NAD kinase family protein [Halobacteriales archaeon]